MSEGISGSKKRIWIDVPEEIAEETKDNIIEYLQDFYETDFSKMKFGIEDSPES